MGEESPRGPPGALNARCDALRREVREFLRAEIDSGAIKPQCNSWLSGFDRAYAKRVGARGWIGMTWPKRYGGGEHSQLERFVVVEEMLAAGAPMASYYASDRQLGPMILRCWWPGWSPG